MSRSLVCVQVTVAQQHAGRILSAVTATVPGPVVGNQQHIAKVVADALHTAADTIMLGVLNDAFRSGDSYSATLEVRTNIQGGEW